MPTSPTYGAAPAVTDFRGNSVAAKWLQDDVGNYILNPITLKPYIVPLSFDLGTFTNKYAAMNVAANPLALNQTLSAFIDNFQAGRVDDLQRSYNGHVGLPFVDAFRPAASFILGVASKAAGLPDIAPVVGGGGYNAGKYFLDILRNGTSNIHINGELGNNPPNDTNIREGQRFFEYLSQGIHIGVSPLAVNTTTQSVANSYVNTTQGNIAAGKAPDGSPLGVSVGDASAGGASAWVKDSLTGTFIHVVVNTFPDGSSTTWEIKHAVNGDMTSAKTLATDAAGVTTVSGEGPLGTSIIPVIRLTRDPDAATSSSSYVVQKGDTLSALAQADGVKLQDYLDANPQITHPNLINIGQVINRPANAVAVPTSNLVSLNTATAGTPTGEAIPDSTSSGPSAAGNNLVSTVDYTAGANYSLLGDVNTATGNAAVANYFTSDGLRPGNSNLGLNINASSGLGLKVPGSLGTNTTANDFSLFGSSLNNASAYNFNLYPVDPLVLDLNGDGVKLTNFADAPVLFDADNDGGSLEQTGWVSAQDGIVVHDLNGDGKINNIRETLSEYYSGVAGSAGIAGTKPFSNGFTALKSLDPNADNQFTSVDAAWSQLRVWVDANHDGKTDAGELKTFAALGITAINLNSVGQSGEVRDGNAVLARGTFTQGGLTREAVAANFLANPAGSTITTTAAGTTITTESTVGSNGSTGVIASFVSQNTSPALNESLSAATLTVRHVTGGAGADTITGDAQNNWLAGGLGADFLSAGSGDDVLLIDTNDTKIDGGTGLDIAQVIGSQGVTLNLSQSNIEIAVGGDGNDVLIGGGRSTVFVRGGAGDDLIIGSAANDVLSGEDGSDLIDGGAGNDLIRGHRGQDQLLGGAGNDVLDGGLEDDALSGGTGNDVLIGGRGDDLIDGGDGIDVAEFSGSYANYRITMLENASTGSAQTVFRVVDTRAGQDGADTLTNVEKLSFSDVSRIDLTLGSPLPVKDVLSVNSTGQVLSRTVGQTIGKTQLVTNDRDWDSDTSQLTITAVTDAKGGSATLLGNGDVLFTPDASYTGVMSFKYKVQDAQGNFSQVTDLAANGGLGVTEPMKATVYLQTSDMLDSQGRADPLAVEQWYLADTNVYAAWGTVAEQAAGQGYSGKGIKIGQFEPGSPFSTGPEVFDYRHPDLAANADKAWLNSLDTNGDNSTTQTFSTHATMVAGVIVAARNGEGGVGVAYNASLAGQYIQGSGLEIPQLSQEITSALARFKNYDVVNNSWGSTSNFQINVSPPGTVETGILDAVTNGRNSLGTAIVMSAGNDRATGANTNTNALIANQAVITVGSINAPGDLGALQLGTKPFSNPGASILVSAPGSNIDSTSRELIAENGSTFGNDYSAAQGTSFAAPIVSGIIALMLEANPKLGYRDIQSILALTATKVDDPNGTDWAYNTANYWNGGGMHTSHDYGFGKVDARAAVRLAETWYDTGTAGNVQIKTASSGTLGAAIADGTGVLSRTLTLAAGLEVESAQVTVDLSHQRWGDLIIKLISPTGTESILVNRPGKVPGSAATDFGDATSGTLAFGFNTTHVRGEASGGNWTLKVTDAATGNVGTLNNWKLDLYGATADSNDVYVYTNEFADTTGRTALNDSNGGSDIINASAATGNSTINLNAGQSSTIAGKNLVIDGNIERAIGGDSDDTLIGNVSSNVLLGGRGNDILSAGAGIDRLQGGRGSDTLAGGTDRDFFVIQKDAGSVDTLTDFNPSEPGEKISLVGFENIVDFSQVNVTQEGGNTRLNLSGGQSILLLNIAPSQISEQNFVFSSDDTSLDAYLTYAVKPGFFGTSGAETVLLPNGSGDLAMFGLGGDDLLGAQTPNDLIDGGDGNDQLWGDYPGSTPVPGLDWLEGGAGNDNLLGGPSDDRLVGGSGNDQLFGEDGNDSLFGNTGSDYLDGSVGNDLITLDGDFGSVNGSMFGYYGTRVGGSGADIFKVLPLGGGNGGFSASGTLFSASNLIADFNPNQAGEKIDVSALTWITSLNDLALQSFTVNGVQFARISVSNGSQSLNLTIHGVASSQLNASHFVFALAAPGAVTGSANNDTLTGDAGANSINGLAGIDSMVGRTGDDTYTVDNVGDTVSELPGGGYDTVQSSASYTISPNVEMLVLTGSANLNATGNGQRNRLVGNSGSNRLDGGAEADDMVGGAGNDVYIADNQLDTALENSNEGADTVEASVSWTLGNNFENLTLTGTGNVNATGNDASNTLTGNLADNALDGSSGADSMAGGLGNDRYYVDNIGDIVIEALEAGIDTIFSAVSLNTVAANVENAVLIGAATALTGNNLDNRLVGNGLANTLMGGAGSDVLDGGAGADTMVGGTGDDTYFVDSLSDVVTELTGEGVDTLLSSIDKTLGANVENLTLLGAGNLVGTGNSLANQIDGNNGNNLLTGGLGNDTISGGAGTDTATFSGLKSSYTITKAAGSVTVSGADGVVVLTGVEKLRFDDATLNLVKPAVSDFNADGNSDLLWFRQSDGYVYLWTLTNNVQSGGNAMGQIGADWTVQTTGDFNGDGTADFVWKNANSGQFYIWNFTNGIQSGGANLGNIGTNWNVMGSGDFNADGTGDIVWRDSNTGQLYLWMMQNNAIASSTNLGSIGVDWTVQAVGDFNGDGTSDLALRNTATGQAYLWNFTNGTLSGGNNLGVVPTNWAIMGSGDFNADGTDDLAWRNNSNGNLNLWMMQNDSISSTSDLGTIGAQWTIDAISDVNADGTSDLLLKNSSSGQFYIWDITNGVVSGGADLGLIGADWQLV